MSFMKNKCSYLNILAYLIIVLQLTGCTTEQSQIALHINSSKCESIFAVLPDGSKFGPMNYLPIENTESVLNIADATLAYNVDEKSYEQISDAIFTTIVSEVLRSKECKPENNLRGISFRGNLVTEYFEFLQKHGEDMGLLKLEEQKFFRKLCNAVLDAGYICASPLQIHLTTHYQSERLYLNNDNHFNSEPPEQIKYFEIFIPMSSM